MNEIEYLGAFLIAVLSAARITRLVVIDSFPPSAWLRAKWDDATDESPWNLLLHCSYCFSFWVTGVILGLGWATDYHPAWWFVNAMFAAAYLAAIVVVADVEE